MKFERLRLLRKEKGNTQQDIGDLLGMNQTIYSRYERGFQIIPLQHLLKLADYYGVSIDYIVGRTDNPEINQ